MADSVSNRFIHGLLRDEATGTIVVSGLSDPAVATAIAWTGTGTTRAATTQATLVSAIAASSAGDTITLADGNYDLTATVVVNKPGIRIKSLNPKGAVLRGATAAPTAANAETTPAHVVRGFNVTADGVWIEDIHFKWFGIAVDIEHFDNPVVQGCRFESCFDSGVTFFDCIAPRLNMNEFLDPYLAGDTGGTLTARGVADAQMDYGSDIYGCTNPRVTHNYISGVFNQGISFKEGNQNPYAGYNTFEGTSGTALFFGQNVPANGPYASTGLPNGPDIGNIVAEFNVFRPVKNAAGQMYLMAAPIRVWHVNGDTVIRGNVIEAAVSGIKVEGNDGSQAGFAAGTVLLDGNTVGGSWNNAAGTPIDVATYGVAINTGVTAAVTMTDTVFANHYDPLSSTLQKNRQESTAAVTLVPTVVETGTLFFDPNVAVVGGPLNLKLPVVRLDPDLSWATAVLP